MSVTPSRKSGLWQRGWLLPTAAGAIALALLGFGIARLMAPPPATTTETATPLPQRVDVVALGRLEPKGEVIRVGGPTGERIKRLEIKEGDRVQTGQVLAYLENYDEQKAQRDVAASQLAESEQQMKAATTYGQTQIQQAATEVEKVRQPGAFEMEAQRATIRELEAEVAVETQDLERFRALAQDGAIAQQTFDQQQSTVRQAQEKLNNAKATLIRLETALQTDIRSAQATLQTQRANLPLSQIQIAVESARQNLNLAAAQLERTIIRSPSNGRVLRILARSGEALGQEGSILDLGDTREMYVVAEVYETDVGLVKIGQSATIMSRNGAFATALTGKVAEIGWQVFKNDVLNDDPAANADARVVEVKVRLDDSKPVEALTNLQVDVKIDVKN